MPKESLGYLSTIRHQRRHSTSFLFLSCVLSHEVNGCALQHSSREVCCLTTGPKATKQTYCRQMPVPVQRNYLKYLIHQQKADGNTTSLIQPHSYFPPPVGLSGTLCLSHYLSDYPAVLYLMVLGLYHPRMEK